MKEEDTSKGCSSDVIAPPLSWGIWDTDLKRLVKIEAAQAEIQWF